MIDIEITAENKSMAGIYQIYEYCKGAIKTCSSNPLMKFMLVIEG